MENIYILKIIYGIILVMNELLLEKYAYKKKKPVLLPYIDNIKLLLEHDATQKSILEYLKNEEGITVSQPYLSKFIRQYIYDDMQTTILKKPTVKQLFDNTPKYDESIQDTTSSNSNNQDEIDRETHQSMEEYMKNMSHIFEAKKRKE